MIVIDFSGLEPSAPVKGNRDDLDNEILGAPSFALPTNTDDVDDLMIRRFLQARDLDVEKASTMFLKYLKWRREFVPNGFIPPSEISNDYLCKDRIRLDAFTKGNLGRFVNHSWDPNCRTEKWMVNGEVCIGLFTLRDIKKEVVTFDYNCVRSFGAPAKKCVCGSPNCRGYIGGDLTSSEVIAQDDSYDDT